MEKGNLEVNLDRHTTLSDMLTPMLLRQFPDRNLRLDSPPAPCAVFPAIHPEVGDLEVHDDGDELTVVAGNFTHGHFSNYDPNLTAQQKAERITEEVVAFLKELFADEIVLYGSHEGFGGWYKRGENSEFQGAAKGFVWSGPLK